MTLDPRVAWDRYGIPNFLDWKSHLQARTAELAAEPEGPSVRGFILQAEIVFGVTSFLNRLAKLHYATPNHLRTRPKMVPWLAHAAAMPPTVAEAFWSGLRNSVVHVGSWSPFHFVFTTIDGKTTKPEDMNPTYVYLHNRRPEMLPEAPAPRVDSFGSIYSVPDDPSVFLSRGLGWASSSEVIDETMPFHRLAPRLGYSYRVDFVLLELLELLDFALDQTRADLSRTPTRRIDGLARITHQAPLLLEPDDYARAQDDASAENSIQRAVDWPSGSEMLLRRVGEGSSPDWTLTSPSSVRNQ